MNIKNKLSSLMYAPLALALLAACSSDDVVENNQPTTQGQTLTINATTGGEDGTRVDFGNDGNGTYATSWEVTDQVRIYAGNINNVGTFKVVDGAFTKHNAKLTGELKTTLTEKTTITGYIVNGKVKTSTNGVIDENGFGKQIEVDYSVQDGTWEDAVSRCVLFGKGTYDPANADQPVNMNFEYKTTFFKLILNFGKTTATSANLCLTGDNIVTKSRIHALNNATNGKDNAGATNYFESSYISIPKADIKDNKATVYVALYSRGLTNVSIQAVLDNGEIYDFDISNNKTQAVTPSNGKVYTIERTGKQHVVPATLNDLKGTGVPSDPYQIGSIADLKCMANNLNKESDSQGKYFELTSDIIINGEWTPISQFGKAFRGVFDGKGHTISGDITINNLAVNQCAGLFGVITSDGVIKNLTSKVNINATSTNDNTSNTYTGSIVGRIITAGTVENCVNKGAIKSTTQFVGGLIGAIQLDGTSDLTENKKVIVEACANEGDVANNFNDNSKTFSVGGIIGFVNGNSSNANCKSDLEVKGCCINNAKLSYLYPKYSAGIIGLIQNPRDADQSKVTACWVKNITLPTGGNRASIVSSGGGNKTDASKYLPYTINYCWADKKYNSGFACSVNAVINECKIASEENLDVFYSKMNSAWKSATYEFNNKGEIVKIVK